MPVPPRFLPSSGYDASDAARRAGPVVRALARTFGSPRTALTYEGPFQLLVATILSAQCTDETVNSVTPVLFGRYADAASLAAADPDEVERIVYATGFFRQKTKSIIGTAHAIVTGHGGQVPRTIEELTRLPGVARKTANVVMANCWPYPESHHGIFVDTHIRRISQRLAFTEHEDPVKIERDLMDLLPRKTWVDVPHQLIGLGRGACNAKSPRHEECPLLRWCPTGLGATAATPPRRRARRQSG